LNHHTQISIYPSVEQKGSGDDDGDDDDDNVLLPESSDVSEQKIRNQFLQPQRGKQHKTKNKKKKHESSRTLFAHKIDRSTKNGMENG
jgi:hypothetical protein